MIPSRLIHTPMVKTDAITINGDDWISGTLGLSTTHQSICSMTLDCTGAANVFINFSCLLWGGTDASHTEFLLKRDTDNLYQITNIFHATGGVGTRWLPVAFNLTDQSGDISKGEHTYTVYAKRVLTGTNGNVMQRSIHGHEFRR